MTFNKVIINLEEIFYNFINYLDQFVVAAIKSKRNDIFLEKAFKLMIYLQFQSGHFLHYGLLNAAVSFDLG